MPSNSSASYVIGSGLPSTQAVFYDRLAVESLFATLGFMGLTTERLIPKNSGRTIQIYSYDLTPWTTNVSANSADTAPTKATEGTVGTPLVPTESSITAVMGQYTDYTNISDFAIQVDIGTPLEQVATQLGYRGALVVDTLIQQAFDAAVTTDSTCSVDLADGTYLTRAVLNTAVATIRGKNGRTFDDGMYRGIIHPYAVGDVANDTSTNGVLDIMKHTAEGQEWIKDGLVKDNQVIPIAGILFKTSTNVPLYTSVPSAGHNAWGTYITANHMMYAVGLGGFEDVPDENNFKAEMNSYQSSAFDPANQIGGAAHYNFKFVATPRPGTTLPFRRLRAETLVA